MNIDKLIASIPGQSRADRALIRARAVKLLESGTGEQKDAANRLVAAIDDHEASTSAAHSERIRSLAMAQRIVEAFTAAPLTENQRKLVQALLDNPGATSTELSSAYGHPGSMIWQMHFGNLCKDRQSDLWPAERSETRDALFYCGILADIERGTSRFTMKADAAVGFAELGLKARTK
ncbi:hypothetical protein [Neorhizobium tomejilense]|uniref:hypothetical protein n=1 Tax=Neorhizobium tomejilense TaxID=2093828 RepID=UPI003ED0299B